MYLIIVDGYTIAKKRLTPEVIKKYNASGIITKKEVKADEKKYK